MAGSGSRFYNLGYKIPKPLIEIQGFPFFYYSAKSLVKYYEYKNLIFIGLKEHNTYNISNKILHFFPDAKIKLLDKTPPGAVLTSREAIELIDNKYPVIFNDCDHCFYSEEFRINQNKINDLDGFLLTFKSNKSCYSYCIKDNNNKIIGTKEKEVVSNDAIAGVYEFRNISLFDEVSKKYLKNCSYSEFFTSGVYNIEPLKNGNIINFECDFNISFGTVEEFFKVKENKVFELFK